MRSASFLSFLLPGLCLGQDLPTAEYDSIQASATASGPEPGGNPTNTLTNTVDATALLTVISDMATGTASVEIISGRAVPAGVVARQALACTTRSYNGPQVTAPADTPDAFLAYQPFHAAAMAASNPANVPDDFMLIPGFSNLNASAVSTSYLTYTTDNIFSYDLNACALKCDSITGCQAFNIFYERDPLVVDPNTQCPSPNLCPGLSSNPSATFIKCAFYNSAVLPSEATNPGQYQDDFHLVISGSNAYARTAVSLPGYDAPIVYHNKAISIPTPVINYGYLRIQTFGTNVPYNVTLCALSCQSQSDYNSRHGGSPCVFFNAYNLYKNGANPVFTCVYYSKYYDASYATNSGQYNSAGDHYTIGSSYGYSISAK